MVQATSSPSRMPATPATKVTFREIWKLTWPQALMMLLQFLIGFINVVVAGRIDPNVQAAFGMIGQCYFILIVVGAAIASGGSAAMSQALGAKLTLRASRYAGFLCKVIMALSFVTMGLGYLFRNNIFSLLAVPVELQPLTKELWLLFLAAVPASYFAVLSMAIFRSRKILVIPLVIAILICILNVFGDVAFGLGWFGFPQFGARGLAYSTLIAAYTGCIVNVFILFHKRILTRESFAPWRWEKRATPYILKVALPSGASQLSWQLGYLVLFAIVAQLPDGAHTLAGFTAGNRIESILFLPTMAFHMTATILIGHTLGGGNRAEAKRTALRLIGASIIFMSVLALVVYQFLEPITAFVAPNADVRRVASIYLIYNFIFIPFTCISMTASGVLSGAGATVYTFLIYGASTWLVRIPLAWYLGHKVWNGITGVCIGMMASQVIQSAAVMYLILFRDWYRFASTAKRFSRGK